MSKDFNHSDGGVGGSEMGERSSEAGGEETEGREGEALLHQCCADLGVNLATALQIVAWADENMPDTARGERGAGAGKGADTARVQARLIKILEYGFRHPSVIHQFAVLYAHDLPILDDIIGHHTPASFAEQIGVHREAVNKVVKAVVREFGLPARRGMRDATACENMRQARIKQLKKR